MIRTHSAPLQARLTECRQLPQFIVFFNIEMGNDVRHKIGQGRNQDFAKGGAELYTFQSKNSIAYWCICIIKRGTV